MRFDERVWRDEHHVGEVSGWLGVGEGNRGVELPSTEHMFGEVGRMDWRIWLLPHVTGAIKDLRVQCGGSLTTRAGIEETTHIR